MTGQRIDALRALKAKVRLGALSGEPEDMYLVKAAIGDVYMDAGESYAGSLDAACALHEAMLPGWSILLHGGHHGARDFGAQVQKVERDNTRRTHTGRGDTPARAWLIAILSALIAIEETSLTPPDT